MDFNMKDQEQRIQKFVAKFSKKLNINQNVKKTNINSSEIGYTEQEERRQIASDLTNQLTSFYNLSYFQDTKDLINKYRQMTMIPEVSDAVEQYVDESISMTAKHPIKLDLTRNNTFYIEPDISKALYREFDLALELTDFYNTGDELIRQYIVDGRLYFENIYDMENIKKGIIGLNLLNPKNIEFFYDENDKLFFSYMPNLDQEGSSFSLNLRKKENILFPEESITFVHSGNWDINKEVILGWLHPALKESLRLSIIEDSAVVYRVVRAPEKRIFKIHTAQMPPKKAEEYVERLKDKFRARKMYDPQTGQIVTEQMFMNMLEDIWIPQGEKGGTDIETLPGGQNLGEIEDILYFQKKLFKALRIPRKRIDPDDHYTYVSEGEINYEEYQFLKHIQKIRNRFSYIWKDIMKKNCMLKGILPKEDFEKIKINFIWETDSKFDEVNSMNMLERRVNLLGTIQEYIGQYYSKKWVRETILKMTSDDIKYMDEEIAKENEEAEKLGLNATVEDPGSGSMW